MADPLKFLNDLESKVVSPARNRVRRTLDAVDDLRTDNSRLKQENDDLRVENARLRAQLAQTRTIPGTPTVKAPTVPEVSVAPPGKEEEKDATQVRFSLMELE
jgi:regulator of replication initiation timing